MRSNGEIARSSRGRTIIRTEAAIAGAASRRGKGNEVRGTRGGRRAATAPRGGRGAAAAPRVGRGAAAVPRGGRGAAAAPRGAATTSRGARVRRLEFVENDEAENDDAYEGDGDEDEVQEGNEDEADEENEDEADEENEGDIWLHDPATLPPLPANEYENQWKELGGGGGQTALSSKWCHHCDPKGEYPGLVEFNGRNVYPKTWKHFAAAPDAPDNGVQYENCLERVEETFWKYCRWATNLEDNEVEKRRKECDARRVLHNVVKKSLTQLYYETHITAVCWYYAKVKKEKVTKSKAKEIKLTEAQYVAAILSWMSTFPHCWITIVQQRWCREWLAKSEDCKIRRSLMVEPAHRQGSSSLTRYKKIMEKQKRPITELAAYIAARTGSEDGVVCNDRAKQVVEKYSEAAKEKYGADFDPMNEPLDPDIMYKVGCGKKHGRHLLADGYIDSRVSASQCGSMSNATEDNICPAKQIRTPVDRIVDLESKVDNLGTKFDAIHEILLRMSQNQNIQPIAASTPGGTPGTTGSIGNLALANNVSPHPEQVLQEQVEENNDDVVM